MQDRAMQGSHSKKKPDVQNPLKSLVYLCRSVIVTNLERYPPESFGVIDEETWNAIIDLRHRKTRPKEGAGGLDGTGRLQPAVTDKFLEAVEECNPHLAESVLVDELIWKDCVEYHFRRGGLTRPDALKYPWPVLVDRVKEAAESLKFQGSLANNNLNVDSSIVRNAIGTLETLPMNVALLRDSGVGKDIRKILKSPHPDISSEYQKQLNDLLSTWMALAADSGIEVKGQSKKVPIDDSSRKHETKADLAVAETCLNWRQLFAVLKRREEKRRTSQGKRMREIRRNLAETRPKLVKVKPAVAKHGKANGELLPLSTTSLAGNKLLQVRKEAIIQSSRQGAAKSKKYSFGDAVAFAAGTAQGKAHRTKNSSTMVLDGNKSMKVPTQVVKGAGPRLFAPKWKK